MELGYLHNYVQGLCQELEEGGTVARGLMCAIRTELTEYYLRVAQLNSDVSLQLKAIRISSLISHMATTNNVKCREKRKSGILKPISLIQGIDLHIQCHTIYLLYRFFCFSWISLFLVFKLLTFNWCYHKIVERLCFLVKTKFVAEWGLTPVRGGVGLLRTKLASPLHVGARTDVALSDPGWHMQSLCETTWRGCHICCLYLLLSWGP